MVDTVMVIGTRTPIGLELVRSLGSKGIRVIGVGTSRFEIGMASRYLFRRVILSSLNLNNQIDQLLSAIIKFRVNYVMAIGESQMVALNRYREQLETRAKLLFPPQEKLAIVLDKTKTLAIAQTHGVPVPEGACIRTVQDIETCKQMAFPLVAKPSSRHLLAPRFDQHDFRVKYFHTYGALSSFLISKIKLGIPILVQEQLTGPETCVAFLRYRNRIQAHCQFEFARESSTPGIPTVKQVIGTSQELLEHGRRILDAIDWEGVALLDFIQDRQQHTYKLLEINGRFWGSTTVCVRAGVDFPYYLYLTLGKGLDLPPIQPALSTRVRNLGGELNNLFKILTKTQPTRANLKPTLSSFCLPFFKAKQHEVQLIEDPLPGILDICLMFKKLFSR